MLKQKAVLPVIAVSMFVASASHAAGLTDLTSAVDFSDVLTAIPAAGALLAAVYVLMKGARLILGFIRR